MENINRECIFVVFIGISLLLSLIVNWQLNVYAHKFRYRIPHIHSRLERFQSLLLFSCEQVKTIVWTQYFHYIFSEMKMQTFENAFVWTGPNTFPNTCK